MCDAIIIIDRGQDTSADRYTGWVWVETINQMLECGLIDEARIEQLDDGPHPMNRDACLCQIGRGDIEHAMQRLDAPWSEHAGWWMEKEPVQ